MININSQNIFERGLDVVGLLISKIQSFDGGMCTAKWAFSIQFVMFTSNYLYSVVCNKYFGKRDTLFEVKFRMLDFTLSWWFRWFITTKVVELAHISSKTWWEEYGTTYDAVIGFVSNSSTAFENNILSNTYIINDWLESFCIIVCGG